LAKQYHSKYYELLSVTGQLSQTFTISKIIIPTMEKKKTNTKFIIILVAVVLGGSYGTYNTCIP
jgi:hypothetical protein